MRYLILPLLLCLAGTAAATQPECVGDRHYDGVACCPTVTECEVCEPVLPCPDPGPCQKVECKDGNDGNDGTTTVVTVDRCPEAEVSEVCKVRSNGIVVCPRAKRAGDRPGPRKILVPRSIIDKIADRERY